MAGHVGFWGMRKKEEGVVSRWNVRCKNLCVPLEFKTQMQRRHLRAHSTGRVARHACTRAAAGCEAPAHNPLGKTRDKRFFNKP